MYSEAARVPQVPAMLGRIRSLLDTHTQATCEQWWRWRKTYSCACVVPGSVLAGDG